MLCCGLRNSNNSAVHPFELWNQAPRLHVVMVELMDLYLPFILPCPQLGYNQHHCDG
jgi:hypothetical protein